MLAMLNGVTMEKRNWTDFKTVYGSQTSWNTKIVVKSPALKAYIIENCTLHKAHFNIKPSTIILCVCFSSFSCTDYIKVNTSSKKLFLLPYAAEQI